MSALLGLGGTKTKKQITYAGLNVSSSKRDMPVAIFWGQRALSPNAIWYNDFQKHKQSAKGKGGGAKGGQYSYTAAVIVALCEGPIDGLGIIWQAGSTTTTTTLAKLNYTLALGTASQTPDPWVVSHYPSEARAYAYTTNLFSPKLDLGFSAEVPDNTFEGIRSNGFSYTVTNPGWINPETHVQGTAIDVLMSDVIVDWLTNVQYGMTFSAGDIGSTTQYATYLRAQGLVYSPLLNAQDKGTSVLDRWAQQSNSWIYFDGLKLQFVPLGDSTITANGVTYTPDTDVAYSLGPDDFIEPLTIRRKDPRDCYNRTILNFTNRTIGYVSDPVEYRDDTLVDEYGLEDNTGVQGDDICDPTVAAIVVQLIGKRAANIRNVASFKTNYRFIRCLPGTIIEITDPNIGLVDSQWRVSKISENDNGELEFEAEEFPGNIGTFTPATVTASNPPTFPNLNTDPGSVNVPAVAEPDSSFTGGVARLLIAASGGANWGSGQVNVSFDGLSYNPIGDVTQAAIQGLLTATLPDHTDPDTVDTLSVDCTISQGAPETVTHADADAFRSLALVCAPPVAGLLSNSGELLSFGDELTTGTYSADLSYLRRAAYGTAHSAHATSDLFSMIDVLGVTGTTLSYDLPPQYIGTTIYIKILSRNSFDNSLQDISLATEYRYLPTGRGYGTGAGGLPATPTGLAAASSIASAGLTWAANAAADNVTSYQVWGAPGTSIAFGSTMLLATTSSLGTTIINLSPNTGYTFYLVAVNSVGSSSPEGPVNVTTSTSAVQNIKTVGFNILSGATGTDVADPAFAFGPGSFSEVAFLVWTSDPTIDLTFDIKMNGVSILATPVTVPHATAPLTVVSLGNTSPNPLSVAKDNVFTIDISSGSASWSGNVQVR